MKSMAKIAFLSPFLIAVAAFPAGTVTAAEAPAVAQQQKQPQAQAVYRLGADGLSCPFCAYGIEKELTAIDGVATVETDVRSGVVIVTMKQGAGLEKARAREAVEAAGFTLRSFERES